MFEPSDIKRFFAKVWVDPAIGCWNWTACRNSKGYGKFTVGSKIPSNQNPMRKVLAHRWSFQFHRGDFDKALLICHNCDNPSCVNPSHLFVGTATDNMQDALRKGRLAISDGMPKLSPLEINLLCVLRTLGHAAHSLAVPFGVGTKTVEKHTKARGPYGNYRRGRRMKLRVNGPRPSGAPRPLTESKGRAACLA